MTTPNLFNMNEEESSIPDIQSSQIVNDKLQNLSNQSPIKPSWSKNIVKAIVAFFIFSAIGGTWAYFYKSSGDSMGLMNQESTLNNVETTSSGSAKEGTSDKKEITKKQEKEVSGVSTWSVSGTWTNDMNITQTTNWNELIPSNSGSQVTNVQPSNDVIHNTINDAKNAMQQQNQNTSELDQYLNQITSETSSPQNTTQTSPQQDTTQSELDKYIQEQY